jgi:hypothetical protein
MSESDAPSIFPQSSILLAIKLPPLVHGADQLVRVANPAATSKKSSMRHHNRVIPHRANISGMRGCHSY